MEVKKATIKSLQLDILSIKEELKDVKSELKEVKEELKEVKDEKEKHLNAKHEEEESTSNKRSSYCRKCDKSFNSKKSLNLHVKKMHPQKMKCRLCEETFDENIKLERHISLHHESTEKFDCNECGKSFVLKWRLTKHKENHANLDVKKCHYFNNSKDCPFEKMGCMFAHSPSVKCFHGKNCNNKLCSYQHEVEVEGKSDSDENKDENETYETRVTCNTCFRFIKNDDELIVHLRDEHGKTVNDYDNVNIFRYFNDESESEEEENLQCELCGHIAENFDMYIDHTSQGDCVSYCDHCDETFVLEADLKKHKEKHCEKCGKEFSSKKTCETHTAKCVK